jgi:hypothetical protein
MGEARLKGRIEIERIEARCMLWKIGMEGWIAIQIPGSAAQRYPLVTP